MSKHLIGLVLIDAPHSALNNAGTEASQATENIVVVKRNWQRSYPLQTEVELQKVSETTYCDTLLPFPNGQIYGQLQALPTHFTRERPRRPQGIRPFYILTERVAYRGAALQDMGKGWGVYLHEKSR